MILFEISQGFVARGAAISWLSQYPNEEEILLPPLSVLEVVGTHVEGAVLVVELRPAMMPPKNGLRSGQDDCQHAEFERAEIARKAKEEREEKERQVMALVHSQAETAAVKRKAKAEALLKARQMQWQQSMAAMQLAAAKRTVASKNLKLARAHQEISRA